MAKPTTSKQHQGSKPGASTKLLERVVEVYGAGLANDPRGREALVALGVHTVHTIETYRLGYAAGTLISTLPEDRDLRSQLLDLQVLDADGEETLAGSITVPLVDPTTGAMVGIYGRRVDDGADFFVPGVATGLANPTAAKRSKSILITTSVLDAVALDANGFRNTIAVPDSEDSRQGLKDLLARAETEEVYVIRLAVVASREAVERVMEAITATAVKKTHVIDVPEPDLITFFRRKTPEDFEALLQITSPSSTERSTLVEKRGETGFEITEGGFTVTFGTRTYTAKAVSRSSTSLRVVLQVETSTPAPTSGVLGFELFSIDLYSSRARAHEAKGLSKLLDEPETLIREDLLRLVEKAERAAADQGRADAEPVPCLTPTEETEGLALLRDPEIENRIVEDLDALGLVGEETNGLLAYLVATSRKLDEPLSMIVQSRSGAGKTTLQDRVLALMPPEDVKKFTRITNQALFYQPENGLKRKVLALEEAEGIGGAVYSIRALQSAGEVQILATGKNATTGQMESRSTKVEGPIALFVTTTRTTAEIDGEMASRNIFVTIDESRERTEAILQRQRDRVTLDGMTAATRKIAIQRRHWAAQRLLEPLRVVNPYAGQLRFPSEALSARRDHAKYLGVIAAIAFLRQKQRGAKTIEIEGESIRYVEVEPGDITLANRLVSEVLGHALDDLSPPSRRLVEEIRVRVSTIAAAKGIEPDEVIFTRRDVRTWAAWSDWQARHHLAELVDLEALVARQGERGKEFRYVLGPTTSATTAERLRAVLVDPVAAPESEKPQVRGTSRSVRGGAFEGQPSELPRDSRERGGRGENIKSPRKRSREGAS